MNWTRRKWGILPRIENGCLQGNQPPDPDRLDDWLRARVQVPARPDWYFVKLHTHGAPEMNQQVLLGEPMVAFHRALARRASEDSSFQFHYVTAREMYNLARAAEAGWQGTVDEARDYELIFNGGAQQCRPPVVTSTVRRQTGAHAPQSSKIRSRTLTRIEAMINAAARLLCSARLSLPTNMSGRLLALVLAWVWVWPFELRAADYWVAPDGRDATGRGSRSRPWATLQYAADQVREWDTVHVLDGDYEGFYLTRGGTKDAPVQFRAEGGHVRITKRNPETPDGINIEGARHVIIEGFVINGMPRAGIRATHSAGSTIRRIVADRNRSWGIYTSFCEDILIEGNTVSRSNKEHGIYVSNSGDRPIIRGNTSRGNRVCGIHLNGDASQGGDGIISGARIENNVIADNGRGGGSGINCDGVQDSKIQNNLLYDNHGSGISLYRIDGAAGSTGNSVVNNTVIQAADSRWAVNIKNRSTNNLVANNILLNVGPRGSLNVSSDALAGLRCDHNIVVDRFSADDGDASSGYRPGDPRRDSMATRGSPDPRMCSSILMRATTTSVTGVRRSTRPTPRSLRAQTSKECAVRWVPVPMRVPTKRSLAGRSASARPTRSAGSCSPHPSSP